jgi:prepilin-type N-terminal cleavage/methylation domain-containing protein/prepilin-type processing-associated H-X9-DG protein
MKPLPAITWRRRGFTLLELLVVISIIAVLIAMLVPAIQRLREMANRTKCIDNLHQIGMAMQGHFNTHQCYPTNGARLSGLYTTFYPYSLTSYPGPSPVQFMWGMGDPQQGPKTQTGSWAFALLPYLEETNAFQNLDYTVAVPAYMCPSRGRQNPQPLASPDFFGWSYNAQVTNVASLSSPWGKTDYAGNYLLMPNRGAGDLRYLAIGDLRYYLDPNTKQPLLPPYPSLGGARNYPITPSDITDGASNTILVGEKAIAVPAYNTGGWYWDEPIFTGGSGGTTRGAPPLMPPPLLALNDNHPPNMNDAVPFYGGWFPLMPFYYYPSNFMPPLAPSHASFPAIFADNDPNMMANSLFANNFGSPHPGGVNFLFVDGSVRTFSYNVDPGLLQGMLTPAGNNDPTPLESQ